VLVAEGEIAEVVVAGDTGSANPSLIYHTFSESAGGPAQSKTLARRNCVPEHRESVLDCGGPPSLSDDAFQICLLFSFFTAGQ